MSYSVLKKHSKIFNKIPKNIILSNDKLKNDIAKSKYALYRGSTSIFFALSSGLMPIYYEISNEINIDPLCYLKNKSHTVGSIESMERLLNRYEIENFQSVSYLNDIQNLLLKLFSPINYLKILNHLEKKHNED